MTGCEPAVYLGILRLVANGSELKALLLVHYSILDVIKVFRMPRVTRSDKSHILLKTAIDFGLWDFCGYNRRIFFREKILNVEHIIA